MNERKYSGWDDRRLCMRESHFCQFYGERILKEGSDYCSEVEKGHSNRLSRRVQRFT